MAIFNVLAPTGFNYWEYFGNFNGPDNFLSQYTGLSVKNANHFTLTSVPGGPNIVANGSGILYDADGNVTDGTITNLQIKVGSTVVAAYTGLAFDAGDLQTIIEQAVADQGDFNLRQFLFSPKMNITGSDDNDDLRSGNGNDTINLGGGDDYIEIGGGTDNINGGDGYDLISYHWSGGFRGIRINLGTGIVIDQFGANDTVSNVEEIEGTIFNDRTTGTAGDDYFRSLSEGRDRYNGLGTLNSDFDYVDFHQEQGSQGIVVNLALGFAYDTYGKRDILIDIEEIGGTQFADNITGNDEDNWFDLGDGADTANGGAGTSDTASYGGVNTGQGINANLLAGTIIDPWGNTDTVSNIEDVAGSRDNDTIAGTDQDNRFRGGDGADTYNGRLGHDRVFYHNENGSFGVVANLATGVGTDTFGNAESYTSIEGIRGSANADSIRGNASNNWFQGLAGNDTMIGGNGVDVVNYSNDDFRGGHSGVNVNLGTATATDGFGDTDTLILTGLPSGNETVTSIEDVVGTIHDDTITGSGAANHLFGLEGNDSLTGGKGNDWLSGGDGVDTVNGGAGLDSYVIENGALDGVNVDSFTLFAVADDTIELSQAMFDVLALGTLAGSAFVSAAGASVDAADADDRILYSTTTGAIWYDEDGLGGNAKVQIATVVNLAALTAADFDVF